MGELDQVWTLFERGRAPGRRAAPAADGGFARFGTMASILRPAGGMGVVFLLTCLFTASPPCAYLRVPEGFGESCAVAGHRGGAPSCVIGLPPGVPSRLLADGRVCAGGQLYEPVLPMAFRHPGPPDPLPEAIVIGRLCAAPREPRKARRRWWMPTITVSVERGAWWSPGRLEPAVATTVWVSLAFPTSDTTSGAGDGPASNPHLLARRRRELCVASARLGSTFSRVRDVGLRTRARLQMMAWRDELSMELPDPWDQLW